MNQRRMSIDVVQASLVLVLIACPLGAVEFRPVAVWTDAECYSIPPGKYAAEKMIDGDLGTYACLLDDTRTGTDPTVCPPRVARPESVKLIGAGHVDPKRAYTQSYVTITTSGDPDNNPWMTWLKPRSRAVMLPPYHTGACRSRIMDYFEPAHYDVQVSENEKRTFACWLDLLIPFCGSYTQHNTWTDAEKAEYEYFQEKRRAYAAIELETWRRPSSGARSELDSMKEKSAAGTK